jgi:uncharacterized membrane protein
VSDEQGIRGRDRSLAWLLLLGGAVGFVAAFVLVVEKIALIRDPDYVPSCSLNPVLSCGSIMETDQAELFGFPNPLIGVAAFAVLMSTGAAVLAGAELARWYWIGLQTGAVLGMTFVVWLISQSLYVIGALCPYCMVVWAVVVPVFLHVTLRNAAAGVFGRRVAGSPALRIAAEWHAAILVGVATLVIVLIGVQFWSYWSTVV